MTIIATRASLQDQDPGKVRLSWRSSVISSRATLRRALNYSPSRAPPRLRLAKKVSEHPAAAVERPSTIHSFSISVLLQNPGTGNFPEPLRIADKWEDDQIVRPTLARLIGVRVEKLRDLIWEVAPIGSLCVRKRVRAWTRRIALDSMARGASIDKSTDTRS